MNYVLTEKELSELKFKSDRWDDVFAQCFELNKGKDYEHHTIWFSLTMYGDGAKIIVNRDEELRELNNMVTLFRKLADDRKEEYRLEIRKLSYMAVDLAKTKGKYKSALIRGILIGVSISTIAFFIGKLIFK